MPGCWEGEKIIGTQKVFLLTVDAHMCPVAKRVAGGGHGRISGGRIKKCKADLTKRGYSVIQLSVVSCRQATTATNRLWPKHLSKYGRERGERDEGGRYPSAGHVSVCVGDCVRLAHISENACKVFVINHLWNYATSAFDNFLSPTQAPCRANTSHPWALPRSLYDVRLCDMCLYGKCKFTHCHKVYETKSKGKSPTLNRNHRWK